MANSFRALCSGYAENVADHGRTFDAAGFVGELDIGPIPFTSLCQHHVLPFAGSVTIQYVPDQRILGLSKFSRIVQVFSRRLQTQERLTGQIIEALGDILSPEAIQVDISAEHFCMRMRGVRQSGVITKTSARKER